MTLNERIEQLENMVLQLSVKVRDLTQNTEDKTTLPQSVVGGIRDRSTIRPIDQTSGLNQNLGGAVIWNSPEINVTPGTPPVDPETIHGSKGYNKHSHSRYSGGALIKGILEIVEYDDDWSSINPHSQGYWNPVPKIKMMAPTVGLAVPMIGALDLVFNADKKTWGCPAYEIDVKKCFFVERVSVIDDSNPTLGEIKKDSKGKEMKSPLYSTDVTKTSVAWDENGQCWRFYAVYAPVPVVPTP